MVFHGLSVDFHGLAQIGFSIAAIVAALKGRKLLKERKVAKDED